ncbi:MAG: hypothetical protein IJO19_01745 [Clostridia bacterium]|nr:hypothetical protein [Clostridia bacterium]
MDVFFEQIVKKKPNTLQKVLKIGFVVTAIILICLVLMYAFLLMGMASPTYSILSSLLLLASFGIGYLTRWYVKRLYLEYEYSITNGDFDIDRIIGKSKRDRIISTNCKDFEEFGVYDEKARQRFDQREVDSKVIAANLDEQPLYYIVVNHKTAGSVLIVIQPNERILGALKKFVPKTVSKDVFGWN